MFPNPLRGGRFAAVVHEMIKIKIKESFSQAAFTVSKLVTRVPVKTDGNPHTTAGLIISATVDDVQYDRTAKILERASEVGEILGLIKEKRILDRVIRPENCLTCNELLNWENVDSAIEQLFHRGVATTALIMPANRHLACRLFQDTNIQVVESRLAYRRMIASGAPVDYARKCWFLGDFSLAFRYKEAWPITVVPTALDNGAFLRFKASEQGVATINNPRYVVKCTG